jgi:sterol desaturase/sphingolipid hydroxylase (fatty acid hydroxylase superfamily)
MIYKCAVILLLGPLTFAVVIFEILLNASAMFNHSNVRLPQLLDRVLRLIIVTPDMHRVHHSDIPEETNSNYGFFLPFWDYLFGTYIGQPEKGHSLMTIGLSEYQTDQPAELSWSIKIPFKNN